MDFDDLDDAVNSLGPTPEELRAELIEKAKPENIAHPAPEDRCFGRMSYMKMLYLHSMGSNKKMGMLQANNIMVNAPRGEADLVFDYDVLEGQIKTSFDMHQNPAVAEMYKAYGPDFYNYISWDNLGMQNESWTCLEDALELLAAHLKKHGPYDGLAGFDMGACLALDAAREAQEGNPAFQNKFRFLILCSAHGHKEMSDQAARRPKAPLRIPTFFTYSGDCIAWPVTGYEELSLYIDPKYRQIVKHNFGHAPPKFDKGDPGLRVCYDFVNAMRFGLNHHIEYNEETEAMKNLWLPLVRGPPPCEFTSNGPPTRLLVICDPMGAHGQTPEELLADPTRPFDEHPKLACMRVTFLRELRGTTAEAFRSALSNSGSDIVVEEIAYLPKHLQEVWHPTARSKALWTDREDEIVVPWKKSIQIASDLLSPLAMMRGDRVAVLGIGTGGHVARAFAEAMIRERSVVPLGLWLVVPPTISPREDEPEMGSLVNCPVRYLSFPLAINGPPWRLELSTLGPFSHGSFTKHSEMVKMVIDEVSQASSN